MSPLMMQQFTTMFLSLLGASSVICFVPIQRQTRPFGPKQLRTATLPDISTAAPEVEIQRGEDQFDWFKAWHPITPVEILDPEVPHSFYLLGQDLVVWNDGKVEDGLFQSKTKRRGGGLFSRKQKRTGGSWRAFVDECPHRKVPLSEGRVEDDGTLLCSYHAWRFDGKGDCVDIPQLCSDSKTMEPLKKASSCNSFPTQVVNGILYVWPSRDADAALESALTPVVYRPNDVTGSWTGPWNYRELPYGADFFIENVVDGAHAAISHHGIVGDRYTNQQQVLSLSEPLSKDGFRIKTTPPGVSANTSRGAITTYAAPCMVTLDIPALNGAKQVLELYVSPSRPGFCNHVGRMVIQPDSNGEFPSFLRMFTLPMPKWLNHVLAHMFLNQDALFLHFQERKMAQKNYYSTVLPDDESTASHDYPKSIIRANSDIGVIKYRKWLKLFSKGRIPYRFLNNSGHQIAMPAADREVCFDTWSGHTKYCRYCQGAQKNLHKARSALFSIAAVLATVRPFKSKYGMLANLICVGLSSALGVMIHKLVGMFDRYEFSHAHND